MARAMSRQTWTASASRRLVGVGDHAHLAAGLDGVGVLDAREAARHRLQLLQPLDVLLQRLAAGAGAAGADGVGGGDQHGVDVVDRSRRRGGRRSRAAPPCSSRRSAWPARRRSSGGRPPSRGRPPCRRRAAGRSAGRAAAFRPSSVGHQAAQVGDLERVLQHVLAVAGAELAAGRAGARASRAASATLASSTACLPSSRMCFSISACVSVTTSSMRVGWMRPSWISLVQGEPGRLAADVVEGARR